uniref:Uncharacterized protein n=1 Tax=Romanomermis culicivorax TaxID=13658 RepID=A0A915KXP1_ROMCU
MIILHRVILANKRSIFARATPDFDLLIYFHRVVSMDYDQHKSSAMHRLLDGLVEIGSHDEPLIDYAFSVALESVTSNEQLKLLAECVHRKWLSDPQFPPVAIRLIARLGDMNFGDLTLKNLVFSMIVNDFKDRASLRKISRNLFCNSVHFAFEFMRYFYKFKRIKKGKKDADQVHFFHEANQTRVSSMLSIPVINIKSPGQTSREPSIKSPSATSRVTVASCPAKEKRLCPFNVEKKECHQIFSGMVDPLFDYLLSLIDDSATDQEIALLHYLLFLIGPKLEIIKPSRMLNLMLELRRKVIESRLGPRSLALLMEIMELQSHKWNPENLFQPVNAFYLKYRPAQYFLSTIESDENSNDDDQ